MSQNPLTTLKIDHWYKLLPAIGTLILVLGLTVKMQGVSNALVQLVSIGTIFIGIGEWINHPLQTRLAPGLKITNRNRVNTFAGNLWDFTGFVIIAIALVNEFEITNLFR